MNPADFNLIQRCLAKDKKAWDEFVERYSHLIYDAILRTFGRYGHPRQSDVLADLHNDIFLFILEDECRVLKQFEGRNGCQLAHYLRTVSIRRTVDFLRRIRSTVSLDHEENDSLRDIFIVEEGSFGSNGAAAMVSGEQMQMLERLIGELKDSDRELCRLLLKDGFNPQEIAGELGISMDYFYVRKKRLLDKLKHMAALRQEIEGEV
jgi:RNA polymerase sigma-70 factor (ECF subfamily)